MNYGRVLGKAVNYGSSELQAIQSVNYNVSVIALAEISCYTFRKELLNLNTPRSVLTGKRKKGGVYKLDKVKCPVCGAKVPADAVYCSKCGSDLQPGSHAFFCIRCGQPLDDGAKYCSYCREPVPHISQSNSTEYTSLVERAIQGDSGAFQEIYEKRFNDLYYIALSMLRNPHDAEDVTQQTFLYAWKSIKNLQSPYAFRSWLVRILSNNCIDLIRKKKPVLSENDNDMGSFEDTLFEETIEFLPADIMDKKETQRLVREIVDALPDNQRQTIILHYFDLLPIIEIASIMDVSEGTVKSRLHYGRLAIREGVEKHEKQGVKLYSFAGLPLLYLVLREGALQTALSPETISALWSSASAGLGIGSAVAGVSGITAGTAAVSETTSITTGVAIGKTVGIASKIAAASIKAKIAVGVAAAFVITGGITVGVALNRANEPIIKPELNVISESIETAVISPEIELPGDTEHENPVEVVAVSDNPVTEDEVPENVDPADSFADDTLMDDMAQEEIITDDLEHQEAIAEVIVPEEIISAELTQAEVVEEEPTHEETVTEEAVEEEPTSEQPETDDTDYRVSLTGTGSLNLTNNSAESISIYNDNSNLKSEFVIYDKDGNVTRIESYRTNLYSAHGHNRYDLSPGSRLVFSLADPSDTITLYYDAEFSGVEVSVDKKSSRAVHYITLTGSDQIVIENTSAVRIGIGKTVTEVKVNYSIFDSTGKATLNRTDYSGIARFDINSGSKLVLSLSNPSDEVVLFFGAELLDRAILVSY